MRKQYHLRDSEQGVLAWDVHRLVALSADLPRSEVPLSEIRELDEPFWYGGVGDSPTCRSISLHAMLIDETDLLHPIILSSDGRVMDGMHRVCKALNMGRRTITALRFEVDPEPDFVGVSPADLPYD